MNSVVIVKKKERAFKLQKVLSLFWRKQGAGGRYTETWSL